MFKNFLSLFKSSVTGGYDIGRVISFKISGLFTLSFAYYVYKTVGVTPINWLEAGGGFAAMLGGCVAIIGGKEVAIAKANSLNGSPNGT